MSAERHPYRQAFEARDVERVAAQLADDVVFHSPVIGTEAFAGKAAVTELIAVVLDALEDVVFTHDQAVEGGHILLSNASVLGKPVKTSTLLELDDAGRIREIWVMARPLTGLAAIAEAMGSGLVERRNPGRGGAIRVLSKPLAGMAVLTDRIGARLITDLNRSSG